MARGAVTLGANTTDRVAIGTSTTIGDASTFTILWIARYTGTPASNHGLFSGTPDSATGTASVIRFQTSGATGNMRLQISGGTTQDFVTSDTPFSTAVWKYCALSVVFGTSTHFYHGAVGNPKSIAESTYSTTTLGATKTTAGTAAANHFGNIFASPFARPWLGDIAMGAFYAGVAFTQAQCITWFQRPRVTLGANVATHFGRGGKDGADWIAYAGTTGTVTGATQANGVGFNQGDDQWQQQSLGSPLYTLTT